MSTSARENIHTPCTRMQYEFMTYNTVIRPRKETCVAAISFTEENTRNRIVAVLKTHEQVRELIEQLKPFAYPVPRYGMTEEQLGEQK